MRSAGATPAVQKGKDGASLATAAGVAQPCALRLSPNCYAPGPQLCVADLYMAQPQALPLRELWAASTPEGRASLQKMLPEAGCLAAGRAPGDAGTASAAA